MLDTDEEISLFESLCRAAHKITCWDVDTNIAHTVIIKLKNKSRINRHKAIDLTFSGVVHGNEVGGLAVCNRILASMIEDPSRVVINIAIVLGNVHACRENIRFKDRDLNRSFERIENSGKEDKRARQLEIVFSQTRFLLDFHQTREPSAFPFFISPYTSQSFLFAGAISTDIPMITHWGKPFSGEGRCSDEFVNRQGGVGLTLETGRNGFELRQIFTGVWAGLKAIQVVSMLEPNSLVCATSKVKLYARKIYTWAESIPCSDPESYVRPGFENFSPVKKGDHLGTIFDRINGVKNEIYCSQDGFILFPKYLDPNVKNHHATAAMEFCRIVKEVSENELGR